MWGLRLDFKLCPVHAAHARTSAVSRHPSEFRVICHYWHVKPDSFHLPTASETNILCCISINCLTIGAGFHFCHYRMLIWLGKRGLNELLLWEWTISMFYYCCGRWLMDPYNEKIFCNDQTLKIVKMGCHHVEERRLMMWQLSACTKHQNFLTTSWRKNDGNTSPCVTWITVVQKSLQCSWLTGWDQRKVLILKAEDLIKTVHWYAQNRPPGFKILPDPSRLSLAFWTGKDKGRYSPNSFLYILILLSWKQ